MNKRKNTFLLALYLFLSSCLIGCKKRPDEEIHEVIDIIPPAFIGDASEETKNDVEIIIMESEPTIEPITETTEVIIEETEPIIEETTEVVEEEIDFEDDKKEIELSLDEVAFLTIGGKYGYGDERRKNITDLGYDYDVVSRRVTELMNGSSYSIPDRNTYYYNFGYVNKKVDVYDEFGNREGSLSAYQKFIISDQVVDDMTLVYFKDQVFYLKNDHIKRIGDSHLEIDISEQKVYFYMDGELINSFDVVTGHPDKGTTLGTNLGITEILRISYNVTFDGGKQSKVFILFNWDGEGFHDANWRESWEFDDKKRYLTHGSNGCCNMKEDDAFFIEENAYLGMSVLIHK